jgi:nitroreductase
VRKFRDEPLPEEVIHAILNAGRRAQSSKNAQTWQFIAIRDKTILKALSECGTWAGHLAGAALGVALLTPDPSEKFQTMFDAGQAAAYMQLAAWELGVAVPLRSTSRRHANPGIPSEWHLRIAPRLDTLPIAKLSVTPKTEKSLMI